MDDDGRVVPGPLPKRATRIYQLPALSAIVGSEESTLFGLDQRIDSSPVGRGDGDANLAPDAFRKAFLLQLRPGGAAIAARVESAPGAPTLQIPGIPTRLPQSGEDNVRV